MAALAKRDGIAAMALRFLILTSARSGEIRGARWSEIDLENGVWTVPGARMKAKKDHRVPLTAKALAALDAARWLDPDLGFPGQRRGLAMYDSKRTAALRRLAPPLRRARLHRAGDTGHKARTGSVGCAC